VKAIRSPVCSHGQRGWETDMRQGLSICHTLYAYGARVNA
jgi:hypothetical protein